ncbi:cell division protein FtsQ/DivIB [Arcanobacterium canis]
MRPPSRPKKPRALEQKPVGERSHQEVSPPRVTRRSREDSTARRGLPIDSELVSVAKSKPRRRLSLYWFAGAIDRLRHPSGDELSLRRAERRRERQRSFARRLGILISVLACLGIIAWVVFGSSLLRYRYHASDVTIVGAPGALTKAKIEKAARSLEGTLLLTMDVDAVEKQLLDDIPEASTITIDRQFPRTLVISARAARPVACMGDAQNCTAVTEKGRAMEASAKMKRGLPILKASGSSQKAQANTRLGISVLAALPPKLLGQVKGIDISDAGLVSMELNGSKTVYWGDASENALKGKIVISLIQTGASQIDVSSPSSPVTK